jgi:hypothetical protein
VSWGAASRRLAADPAYQVVQVDRRSFHFVRRIWDALVDWGDVSKAKFDVALLLPNEKFRSKVFQ